MKKVIISICSGLAILIMTMGAVRQKTKTPLAEFGETHIATDTTTVENMPVIKFEQTRSDFGTVRKRNTPITVAFKFQNIGSVPLLIHKVDVSCGCMTVEFPTEPILYGQEGSVLVTIVTNDFTGAFNKTLFLKSNAIEDVTLLRIVGQIR